MGSLGTSRDIVLDTHAIKELLSDPVKREKVVSAIREACHTLVLPDLRSEFNHHIQNFPMLVTFLSTKLGKGKFVPEGKPSGKYKLKKDLERKLRREGADDKDILIAEVAFRRSRMKQCKRRMKQCVLIVSNDPCFHNASAPLSRYGIGVMGVNDFLNALMGC